MSYISPTNIGSSNTIILIGDSYTSLHKGGTSPGITTPTIGFFNWCNTRLGKRFNVLNYAGISGETTTQILARFDTNVLGFGAGWVSIQGGINDINSSVSVSTIYSNLVSMYERALDSGIKVIGYTIPLMPVFGTTSLKNAAHQLNALLKKYAVGKNNFILIDMNIVLVDESTGLVPSAYTYDNTHLSVLGAAILGDYMYQILDPIIPKNNDWLCSSYDDTYANNASGGAYTNLLTNGMLVGATSGLTTGWMTTAPTLSSGGSAVLNTDYQQSKVSAFNTSLRKYRQFLWQQFVVLISAGAEKQFAFRPSTSQLNSRYSTGDYLYAECEYEMDTDVTAVTRLSLTLQTLVSSGSAPSSIDMFTNGTTNGAYPVSASPQYFPISGVLRTYPVEMTSLVTSVYPELQFRATSGTIRMARFAVKKATAEIVNGITIFRY